MTRTHFTWVIVAAVLLLTWAGIALAPGPTIAGDGPDGTLALERVARDLGFEVDRGDLPPLRGTFVLPSDVRNPDQAEDVLRWVADGNRLVVADPRSPVFEFLGIGTISRASLAFTGTAVLPADCEEPEVESVATIEVRVADRRLDLDEAEGVVATCFRDVGAPFLARTVVGDGEVVLLGGSSLLRNELLSEADNATFALRLLGADGRVRIGAPGLAAEPTGFWASLPEAARALLWAAMVGAGVVVAAAWRRLGRPTSEPAMPALGQGDLVRSVAGLYRESGDRGHVAGRLQAHVAEVVRVRTGLPADASSRDVAAVLADLTGQDPHAAHDLLTTVPTDEEQLVHLARRLHHALETLEAR